MDRAVETRLLQCFPALEGLPPALGEVLSAGATPMTAPAGTVLFEANSPCRAFPMLLSGSIRVVKAGGNGRELQLYRVLPGESCIITSSCLLGDAAYPARGVAECEISAVVVSKSLFHQLVEGHPPFRSYIFRLFSGRLSELMDLVEEVAFRKLDQRLAALLLAKGRTIHATHQNLADELGSVREIISRLLKQFQDQGLVSLGREQIQVIDPERLKAVL
jgi:CRP/FNR family transcriptional regulator